MQWWINFCIAIKFYRPVTKLKRDLKTVVEQEF